MYVITRIVGIRSVAAGKTAGPLVAHLAGENTIATSIIHVATCTYPCGISHYVAGIVIGYYF